MKINSNFLRPLIGLSLGLALSLALTTLAGESPLHIAHIFWVSCFGTAYDFGQFLFAATALTFTGLSVCVAFHAGLFNIGAEGQLTIGALAMTWVALRWPLESSWLAAGLALTVGLSAGGFWGWLPGFLKTRFGSHEVIVTMMLNFVAIGIANFVIVGPLHNPESQNPESAEILPRYFWRSWDPIHALLPDSLANFATILAVLAALTTWIWLFHTAQGFQLRVIGSSTEVATNLGLNSNRQKRWTFFAAGVLAAGVGANEILGGVGKFRMGFSPDYGFLGIAVALLARNHPLGILLTACLFGALQKGAADLDVETNTITRDFARVLEAILILSVVAAQYWPIAKKFRRQEKRK